MTDRELNRKILNAKAGSKEDFTYVVEFYKNDWFRIAKSRLLNNDDAMDAVQESIISIYISLDKLKNAKSFKAWSMKILVNKCNTIYSKYKNRKELSLDSISNNIENYDDEIVFENEIQDMLKVLDSDERTLITLFYVEKYTSKEIGKIMDMNMNTVKTKLFRAKNKIKNFMYTESEGDSIYE